jgi:tripartite-type tricarboxylate transporter receptor subunit TctC
MKSLLIALALVMVAATGALAQTYPERPITLINPYSAGGPADVLARTVAEGIGGILGKPVVVESRPGGGTAIAAVAVARAQPDGYTLLIAGSPTFVIAPALMKDGKFDGIKDFAPIATVGNVPNVLVVPGERPYKTLPDLIAAAKSADGAMTFASVGQGSLPQLLGVMLQQRAGLKLVHVPYGGAAPATVDLVAGRIDLAFLNLPPLLPHIQSGKLRAIAVAQNKRSEALPDVPTMVELGYPDFEMSTWYGISAPAGTPQPIVQKLDGAIAETLKQPAVRAKLTAQGNELFYKNPADFAAYLAADAKRMLQVIDAANLKAN